MLTLAESSAPEALTDALADVASVLRPNAGLGSAAEVLGAARGSVLRFLRRFRQHLQRHALLQSALREADPAAFRALGRVALEHRELRLLSHRLCGAIRQGDLDGAHGVARMLMAILLGHVAGERDVFLDTVRHLDPETTSRFAEQLFSRIMRDLGRREHARASREAIADLHSLYVRLIHCVQGNGESWSPLEVVHEHPCRR
jgi:hypothetical protein